MKYNIKITYLLLVNFSLSALLLFSNCKKERQNIDRIKFTLTDVVKLQTLEVQNITNTTVESGGKFIDDGGKKILAKGICWSTNPRPLIGDETTSTNEGKGTDDFASTLSNLQPNVTYYLRAYAITNEGTAYGNEVQFTTVYEIGDIGPAGGYVFYDKGDTIGGWRYLEAASSDLDEKYQWGCSKEAIDGATGQEVGDGQQNTIDILNGCNEDSIAADMCNKYVLNDFDDWFLPSLGELILMRDNLHKNNIGNFNETSLYCSSSQVETGIFYCSFKSDNYDTLPKFAELLVRPVRAFK